MDIAEWLSRIGLPQYAENFAAEDIDPSVVGSLSDQDLKDLGVASMGHRRKIMAAAAETRNVQTATAPPDLPAPPVPSPKIDAERRPITVMFCDLVGSTRMAATLDAEDWRDLVGAYLDDASRSVAQYGGHVLKKLGDGIMALFGYPKAQENDAERAARAGLAILRALEDLNARTVARGLPALAARIGLETGPVVVDASGEVFGDAPNVAARVQAAAEPGTLLVTANVQRQIAGLFVAEDKGPHDLKGVSGKPTLYRLVRASGGGRRIGARSLTPFVGREEELALIGRRWERARGGEGQFVQIVGEPGLGKSRLMEEFRARLAETPHTWVGWSSSQLLQNTPLHPLVEWGRQRFGAADTSPESRLAELEATLAHLRLDTAEYAPLLAPLLDTPVPEGRHPNLTPEELRRKQLAAVVAWILAGARAQPIVLAFEDLHWADPTTLELMKTLAERGATAPLFVLATARPEFRAPWTARAHHAAISLVPLDRAQIRRMIGAIAEQHALTREAVEGVTDRTGGVPLFIEEVTRLMLEGGAQSIPLTLQQSLAARLDRLGGAREVAQIGAVLGREFSYELLQNVADWPHQALDAALEQLAEADLLFVEGHAPASSYRFKHALIQDAAYESLLRSRRQVLHRRAAEALISAPDPQPEVVAHHYTQANERELAIDWWGKAGEAALGRSAFPEAISHLGKAIELAESGGVAKTPEAVAPAPATHTGTPIARPAAQTKTVERERRDAEISAKHARALAYGRGFAQSDTLAAVNEAGPSVAYQPNELGLQLKMAFRWVAEIVGGRLDAALATMQAMLHSAEEAGTPAAIAHAHRCLGYSHNLLGAFAEAAHHGQRALSLYSEDWAEEFLKVGGDDFLVTAKAWAGNNMWALGQFRAANTLLRSALARARKLDHPVSLAIALHECMIHCALTGRMEPLLRSSNAMIDVTTKHAIKAWRAAPQLYQAWARGRLGDPDEGLARIQTAVDTLREFGSDLLNPAALFMQADLEARAGRSAKALMQIGQGLEVAPHQYTIGISRLHRLKGDILAARDPGAAEAAYREAIGVARSQDSLAFELQAAAPLAKLLQAQGRLLEARDCLAAVVDAFARLPPTNVPIKEAPTGDTEEAFLAMLLPQGEDVMFELAEAQALLAELVQTEPARRERRDRDIRSKYALALAYGDNFAGLSTRMALGRVGPSEKIPFDAPGIPVPLCFGWLAELLAGRLESALDVAQSLLSSATESNAKVAVVHAIRNLGFTKYYMGSFVEARYHGERALSLYSESWATPFREAIGDDFLVTAKAWLAPSMLALGHVKVARMLLWRALHRARRLNHPVSVGVALAQDINCCVLENRVDFTLRSAEAMIDLTSSYKIGAWVESARLHRAWAWGILVDLDEGREQLRAAANALRADGSRVQDAYISFMQADLDARTGRNGEALVEIERALRLVGQQRLPDVSRLHRLKGDILLPEDPVAAEAAYLEAIRVAQSQSAVTFELQAALPLAKLLQSQGRLAEANRELARVVDAFASLPPPDVFMEEAPIDASNEAFISTIVPASEEATPELVEAQALLAELSNRSCRSGQSPEIA